MEFMNCDEYGIQQVEMKPLLPPVSKNLMLTGWLSAFMSTCQGRPESIGVLDKGARGFGKLANIDGGT